jgi:hypothetical protein
MVAVPLRYRDYARNNPFTQVKNNTASSGENIMFKKTLALLIAIAILGVMAFGMISSGAWFTDTATSDTNSLSSGTLSIDDAKLSQVNLGTISNMAPGDKTGDVVIVIENNGTIPLAWFGDLIIGNSVLKDAIYIDYAQMEFLKPGGGSWEPTDNFISDGVGDGDYPTWYNTLAGLSTFKVITLKNFDANNGMGSTPYEFMGALKPGYSYKLTLRFGFAEGAGNDYQHAGPLTVSFKADATQITAGALDAIQAGFGTNHLTWMNDQIVKQVP